jgi:hypothetical protein
MAAQQHQLLQAANAQHMAAMVALEAMQNQAKKNAAQTQASQLALSMGGRGSPVKREHPDLESDSPLPKIMRTMAQSMNPAALAAHSPKPMPSEPRVHSPRSETARSQTPPPVQTENRFMSQSPLTSAAQPNSQNQTCAKSRSPVAQIATAAALGRLFPNVSPSMNAKVNVNETDPDDDSNPGSITMSIEVNGVQYEGILFAKIQDEGYLEAKRELLPTESLPAENTTTVTPTAAPTNSEHAPSSPAEQSSPQK